MVCGVCSTWNEIGDSQLPYVRRTCPECGRKVSVREPGAHGIGFQIQRGDEVILPPEFLTLSANPLVGSGQFTRIGISWFAEMVFGVDLSSKNFRENVSDALNAIIESNEQFFKNSELLKGLDLDKPAHQEIAFERLGKDKRSPEWYGFLASIFGATALDEAKKGKTDAAVWAMACAERYRSLAIFRTHFEEVVFMGSSAKRIVDLLRLWDSNRENPDEGFWQIKLREYSFALSQLFSVPVTFIQEDAYVGGMRLDSKDARFLDFLVSGGSANDAILIEIKTPTSRLLGRKYRRNVFPPSSELGGAVVQVNDYRHSLQRNFDALAKGAGTDLNAFSPKCVVIVGNYDKELDTSQKRQSFELFRGSLAGVDVITFDEFFKKIEQLAKLFNLVRQGASPTAQAI